MTLEFFRFIFFQRFLCGNSTWHVLRSNAIFDFHFTESVKARPIALSISGSEILLYFGITSPWKCKKKSKMSNQFFLEKQKFLKERVKTYQCYKYKLSFMWIFLRGSHTRSYNSCKILFTFNCTEIFNRYFTALLHFLTLMRVCSLRFPLRAWLMYNCLKLLLCFLRYYCSKFD